MGQLLADGEAKGWRARRTRTLETLYGAIGRSDIDTVLACFTRDCRVRLIGDPAMNPFCGARVGHDGVRHILGGLMLSYAIVETVVESVIIDGDEAAVFWIGRGNHRATGVLLETERCDRVVFDGDLVAELTHFFDTASIGLITGRLGLLVAPDRSSL